MNNTEVKKFKLLKQFSGLKVSSWLGIMGIVLGFVMVNQLDLWIRILIIVVGLFLIVNFFLKLEKYAVMYEDSINNGCTASIVKVRKTKNYTTYYLEYEVDGTLIKNKLHITKGGALDRKLRGKEELEITVLPSNPDMYFVPMVMEL